MYAATKLAGEAYMEAFAGAGGPEYLALRIGPIYGPGVSPGSNGAMMLDLLEALDRGERPSVAWTQDSVHSFVYIDDVARAVVASLDAPRSRLAVNVVGAPVTTKAICETTARLYGRDPSAIDYRGERTRYQRVSQTLMGEVLGFLPDVDVDEGARRLIAWHRAKSALAG